VIGFGLSPFLAVHGGTTSDPDQLRTEIELTAAAGIAGPSTTSHSLLLPLGLGLTD